MSATDELRRLLDERGVEWEHGDAAYMTDWHTPDGRHCSSIYWHPGLSVCINDCTPEQAIAATLGNDGVEMTNDGVDGFNIGRTTTRNTKRTVYGNPRPVCEVCGYGIGDKRWHYCPNCGARIVEVDE